MRRPVLGSRLPARSCGGFSVIELLLAAFLLAIGLLGLGALQVMATRGSTGSRSRDAASFLASSVLDQLKADGEITAYQRANSLSISASALLANAPLDQSIVYSIANSAGAPQVHFNFRGGPVEPASLNPDESNAVFQASYVVRSNAKDGDPAATCFQLSREIVVNVTWTEPATQGGAIVQLAKSLSMSRYTRF